MVHQCARFCADPKLSHEKATHKIVRYLMKTKHEGIIFRPEIKVSNAMQMQTLVVVGIQWLPRM